MQVTCGKVPGGVKQFTLPEGATVREALKVAAQALNFQFSDQAYSSNGKTMLDVPYINGRELCTRSGGTIVSVLWDTPCQEGSIVLLVPKIKGNQFLVSVSRQPGEVMQIAMRHADEPEATAAEGTVKNAVELAGLTYDPNCDELRVNGRFATMSTVLNDGDRVVVSAKPAYDLEVEEENDEGEAKQLVAKIKKAAKKLAHLAANNPTAKKAPTVIFGRINEKITSQVFEEGEELGDLLSRNGFDHDREAVVYNGVVTEAPFCEPLEEGESILIVALKRTLVL